MLFEALEGCIKISRLSLVCPSYLPWKITSEEFFNILVGLCISLKNLVALFGHFCIPKEVCREATTLLKKRFKEVRPAFRVDIQPSDVAVAGRLEDEYHSQVLPVMHSDILTRIESQVATFPINCRSFLQRTI